MKTAATATLELPRNLKQKAETHTVPAVPRLLHPTSMFDGGGVVQRKEACACGGGCPRCDSRLPIQTKLALSEPGDQYEQEADRMAEQVTRTPAPAIQRAGAGCSISGETCPQCETEGESQLQPKTGAASESARAVSSDPVQHLGPGQPLDRATRAFFEPRFDHDFSSVRVHADSNARESAESVNALAYTVGRDIVFGAGQFRPGTPEGNRLLAHELTHVVQQTGSTRPSSPGPMVQRQEATDDPANAHAREVVLQNPRIDVRAQFALLRLLRGPDAATAREMIDEIEKDTLKGIFGDDLGKAAEVAANRGKKRWELVPPGKDAILIQDNLLDAPLIIFKESAGGYPRLDRALIDAYRADPAVIKEQCPDARGIPPACSFDEREKAALDSNLRQARERTRAVSELLTRPGGPEGAVAAAGDSFSSEDTPIPTFPEIDRAVNGTLAILESSMIQFACRTCGDPVCHKGGTVAYVVKAGQMPIFICGFRLMSPLFIGEVRRTIIHEAVHLSGIDTDTATNEKYCEQFPKCGGPCHGKDNAESWARYIDCLAIPIGLIPPLVVPDGFPPPAPVKLPDLG